jgi:pimeloyl-ACP methyl ester carboxylesterase
VTEAPLEETFIDSRRLRFAALEAGRPGDPLALCLHGFPDSPWSWRQTLQILAENGYHAVAPFMRGYAPTELPRSGFALADLAEDVLILEEELRGSRPTVLIGHDWGAAAVYVALERDPHRWACAVAASVPPTDDSIDAGSLAQLRRSWYSFLFQLPDIEVPERIAAADDLALVEMLWRDWSPGLEAPEEIEHAKRALRPEGHLRAAITYYRDAPTRSPMRRSAADSGRPLGWDVPLLYLHGRRDGCIGVEALERIQDRLRPTTRVTVFEDAGHFLQLERTAQVSELIVEFLAQNT